MAASGLASGGIPVEEENDLLRPTPELRAVLGRQRGATGRQRLSHLRTREGDRVEIAFAQDHSTRAPNTLEGSGVSVEGLPFQEDRSLRGI